MSYCQATLPPLKVTKRSTSGSKSFEVIHRGSEKEASQEYSSQQLNPDAHSSSALDIPLMSPNHELFEPTTHELERKGNVAGWEKVRTEILKIGIEMEAMPAQQQCNICQSCGAAIRCKSCGPIGYFCYPCFKDQHSKVNMFHIGERWEVDHYVLMENEPHNITVCNHICEQKKSVPLSCIDEYGMVHKVILLTCNCEPLAVSLVRASLWPATPTNPKVGFTFNLLEWAEALMVECQVALKDFCTSLQYRCPIGSFKAKDIYSSLIDSFEEYRYFKYNICHLPFCTNIDKGNMCPACPKDKGSVIYSLDAVFGLPRKKSSGCSYRDPLYKDVFFSDQLAVDEFVNNYDNPKTLSSGCNDFMAGNTLRSASRYKALDETAVFGYCCRHEFPKAFINLKHGERLAYAILMLEKIIADNPEGVNTYVMYDIACTLFSHLETRGRTDILSKVTLCLPTFHSYGHKVACQVLFGPRRCEGVGLSDGETMERLWSYLRRFSRMTKEMRPSHRIDVLSCGLLYYGFRTKEKLASLLLHRWGRAFETSRTAEDYLVELIPDITSDEAMQRVSLDIERWIKEEEVSCHSISDSRPRPVQWKITYFNTLERYYHLRNQPDPNNDEQQLIQSLEVQLQETEAAHNNMSRWSLTDKEYMELSHILQLNMKETLLLQLLKSANRRLFLLKLKKKYADGQKIAKRLSHQLSREKKLMMSYFNKYNVLSNPPITLDEAFDPLILSSKLQSYGCFHIATGNRRDIIDAYLLLSRSKEELLMLKQESNNIVEFYERQLSVIESYIQQPDMSLGMISLLHKLKEKVLFLKEQGCNANRIMTEGHISSVMESDESDFDDASSDEEF